MDTSCSINAFISAEGQEFTDLSYLAPFVVVILFVRAKDYFLYTCCTYIKVQFNLLQKEFEDLLSPSDNVQNSIDVIPLSEFYSKFKDLVTRHQELIRSVTMLEVIFTKSMLYNIGASSLTICLTLFNVTIIKDTVLVMSFFIFLCVTYLQIYFLCNFGHIISQSYKMYGNILLQSIEVSDGIYNSQWYLTDALVGKHLLLVMMRSQRRCKLTAYGFADIDLKVFMRILSNAWSYFALLKTIYP
ncbi:odorant receptor 4-like [Galleria mellonella]|uniref:Odorant receptor 4-like n=1 Tax=Galleria mellonella TaxID=7137 RepID=A0ABM3N351_GALME|nr:odorant receptor 4-like [Galleria mellonella]